MANDSAICPNCKAELYGQFCAKCGQNQKAIDQHFFTLLGETLEDIFTPDSRTARTLAAILLRPGFLTREYFAGRKARYIQPVRLYFISSVVFFFAVSMLGGVNTSFDEGGGLRTDTESIAVEPESEQYIDAVDLDFLSAEEAKELEAKVNEQIGKAKKLVTEDPGRAREMAVDAAPPVIFVLLPIFAALLKLFYIGKGRFYTEHLVLALHNHSFIFIALLTNNLIETLPANFIRDALELLISIWIPVYLLISLKVTYLQGWFITTCKFFLLALMYSILFFFAAVITLIASVLVL